MTDPIWLGTQNRRQGLEGSGGSLGKEIEAQGGLLEAEGEEEITQERLELCVGDGGDVDGLARVERGKKLEGTKKYFRGRIELAIHFPVVADKMLYSKILTQKGILFCSASSRKGVGGGRVLVSPVLNSARFWYVDIAISHILHRY